MVRIGNVTFFLAPFLLGLALSVIVTLLLWAKFGPQALLGFLLVPLFFIGGWKRGAAETSAATCARCGWTTRDESFAFCPRDGERLSRP